MCLVVGDALLAVDAAVQGDVDAEGQESHAASLSLRRGDHHTPQSDRYDVFISAEGDRHEASPCLVAASQASAPADGERARPGD